MESNVFTKEEILQNLASRGYFIDSNTLESFFEKYNITPTYENENKKFYDKNTLDIILSVLFGKKESVDEILSQPEESEEDLTPATGFFEEEVEIKEEPASQEIVQNTENQDEEEFDIDFLEDVQVNIGNSAPKVEPLIDNPTLMPLEENITSKNEQPQEQIGQQTQEPQDDELQSFVDNQPQIEEPLQEQMQTPQYVDAAKPAEFKLDVSEEKTIDVISRVISKKIARHVSEICARDAVMGLKYAQLKKKFMKHQEKLRAVIEQNQKLRLLLVESNKNLNSYKPCGPKFLGLYKKEKSK